MSDIHIIPETVLRRDAASAGSTRDPDREPGWPLLVIAALGVVWLALSISGHTGSMRPPKVAKSIDLVVATEEMRPGDRVTDENTRLVRRVLRDDDRDTFLPLPSSAVVQQPLVRSILHTGEALHVSSVDYRTFSVGWGEEPVYTEVDAVNPTVAFVWRLVFILVTTLVVGMIGYFFVRLVINRVRYHRYR